MRPRLPLLALALGLAQGILLPHARPDHDWLARLAYHTPEAHPYTRTLLDVGEDHDPEDIDDDDPMAGEHHLYMFLSWLVNSLVVALGGPD